MSDTDCVGWADIEDGASGQRDQPICVRRHTTTVLGRTLPFETTHADSKVLLYARSAGRYKK
jgi:hypothetical protein